ncbi:MAG: DUF4097 family beta strand repeat protein [Candidatus Aminicenantes bacterium]|nr:DUF4097 family beta strand repeat protein [Candidatus Aminicenantes bacterium]
MHGKKFVLPVLVAFLALASGGAARAADHEEPFQKVLPLSAKGTFSLKNVNGGVTITTWAEEKVEIKALKKTKKAAENLQKVRIEVIATADSVAVDTVYPKRENTGVSIDYEVKVPEGIHLADIHTVNGGLNLTGPFGRARVSSVNGGVQIESASGELDLETTNGDIKTVHVRGRISAHTTNGSIHLDLEAIEADVQAETTNGSITLQFSAPQEINASLDARTTNGGISFDFPVTLQSLEQSKHRLRGQIGRGGALVSLKTVNGSIRLSR